MQPLRVRITRIIDCGTIVSLLGTDTETDRPVAIHVDHRSLPEQARAYRNTDPRQRIEYAAEGLLLHLNMQPADESDEPRAPEKDNSDREPLAVDGPERELGR